MLMDLLYLFPFILECTMRYERENSEILNLYYMLLEYFFLIKIKDTQFAKLFSLMRMQVFFFKKKWAYIIVKKKGIY